MHQLSDLITIRPIKTEADYKAALAEIAQMMGQIESGTPDGDKFELMVTLVEAYEDIHYPMGTASIVVSDGVSFGKGAEHFGEHIAAGIRACGLK